MLNCSYKFHPVGQGCFFSSRIEDENGQLLNVVFDCGSLTAGNYLDNAIDNYFDSLLKIKSGKKVIDLFIISHFDEDHINGAFELLAKVKCSTLVIPYISIYERIALFSKGQSKSEWHKRFLQNPQNFIINGELDIDRIIILGQPENGDFINNTFEIPLKPVEGSELFSDPIPVYFKADELVLSNQFFYKNTPFTLSDKDTGWKFKFYINQIDRKFIDDFHAEINKHFTFKLPSELLQDKNRLKLKGIYKSIFKNVNKTSLNVCIIPKAFKFINYDDSPNHLFDYTQRVGNVLLTGDSFLYTVKQVESFKKCYNSELKNVLLFQIPHHGSLNNSSLDLISGLWKFPLYVINHGKNRKKHPNGKVLKFLNGNKINFKLNNESNAFNLVYSIY